MEYRGCEGEDTELWSLLRKWFLGGSNGGPDGVILEMKEDRKEWNLEMFSSWQIC